MTWFKVDDNLAFHHKTVAAGNAAMGLWVRAGSFSAQQLTDGFVPDHMLPQLGNTAQAKRLVEVRLWDRVEGGYKFHEWDQAGRQPTREEIERKRQETRARQQAWRDRHRDEGKSNADGNAVSNADRNALATRRVTQTVTPVPTRPDPTLTTTFGAAEPRGEPDRADQLIAEWLDHAPTRPPNRVIGQVGKLLRELLLEGQDPKHVRAGLAAWASKGLHPASLPSCVHEAQTPAHANGRASTMPTVKPPHERSVAEALALPEGDR